MIEVQASEERGQIRLRRLHPYALLCSPPLDRRLASHDGGDTVAESKQDIPAPGEKAPVTDQDPRTGFQTVTFFIATGL